MVTLLRDQVAEAQAAEQTARKEAGDTETRRRRAAEQAALDRTMEQQRLRYTLIYQTTTAVPGNILMLGFVVSLKYVISRDCKV